MNLEDRIRRHYETNEPTSDEPVAVDQVVSRGRRLRRRTYTGAAFLSVAGVIGFAAIAMALSGPGQPSTDAASLSADAVLNEPSLYDQAKEGWTPVPDPVDPELLAIAADLCDFDPADLADLPQQVELPDDPKVLAIDQRGIMARILYGGSTPDGASAISCGAIRIDGTWQSSADLDIELPKMASGSGGPVPGYVAEMRLRFPDGTEVTATIGGGEYIFQYPAALMETLAEPRTYSYVESYSAEGALISSEVYMSYLDYARQHESLPDFDLMPIPDTPLPSVFYARITVMLVWTPSCPHCTGQLRAVQEVAESASRDVSFVGVAAGNDPVEAAAILNQTGARFPNWLAAGNPDLNAMGIAAVPMTLIADETGAVVAQIMGVSTVEELQDAIAEALG